MSTEQPADLCAAFTPLHTPPARCHVCNDTGWDAGQPNVSFSCPLCSHETTPPAAAPALPGKVQGQLNEIRECAEAIVRNLREDIAPELRGNPWVETAACHAAVIVQDCAAIASGHSRPGEFNADMARPALHSVSKLRQERDQLRAEVKRLQRLNLDAVRSIDSRGEEIADLRARLADAQDLRGTGPDLLIAREIYAQLVAAQEDKERLDTLRRLMGYTQDGSNQTVKLFEDDATRDFFIMAGRRTYMGGELRDAIDTARREGGAK